MVHILRMAEGLKINHDQKDPGDGPGGWGREREGCQGSWGKARKRRGRRGRLGRGPHKERERSQSLESEGGGGEGKSWREDVFVYCRDTGWTLG